MKQRHSIGGFPTVNVNGERAQSVKSELASEKA